MSITTVDRLLEKQRRVRRRKAQSTTRAGTLLKHHIPVRHELWPEDTVPAILGRSKQRTVKALEKMESRLPFDLKGIDPDNDGQFINYFLYDWCKEHVPPVDFTRSRAYKKNDNAHIEQKNWSHVRRVFGYKRLDTEKQWRLMEELYQGPLHDWQNFFQPTLKLKEKERRGSRVIKRHDEAKTPYQRVLDSPHVPNEKKQALRAYYKKLNPVKVKGEVDRLINEIFKP